MSEKQLTQEQFQQLAVDAMHAAEELKKALPDLQKKYDGLDIEKINKTSQAVTDALEVSQKLQARVDAAEKKQKELEAALQRPGAGLTEEQEAKSLEKKTSEVFSQFLKKGTSGQVDFADYCEQKNIELKTLSVGSDPDGGYLVMPAFGGVINTRIFETSPVRQFATVETISTDSLELVLDNDEAAASWVSESGTRSATNTPTLDKKVIPTHELYAQPKATQKLLDDASVNVEQWLAGKVSDKFARTEAAAFVSGTGVGQPTGILTNTTTSTSYSATAVQTINSGTSAALTYAGFVNVQNGLKELYQPNARWLMKRATFGSAMQILDGNSRPIFNLMFDKQTGVSSTLMTKPVTFADDVPAISADTLSVIYGDFRAGYTVVDRIGIRVLRDPYSSKPFVLFYTTKRVGGDVVNAEALKIMKLSA